MESEPCHAPFAVPPWDERCNKAGFAASMLMSKICCAEWKSDKSLGIGATILIRELCDCRPLSYEPDPTGRHRMKRIYYVLYRIVIVMIRLWSRPACWLDSQYWIKMDQFGTGLGAFLGVKLISTEVSLLELLKDSAGRSSIACLHMMVDREAAARIKCPLCLERTQKRYIKFSRYLDNKVWDLSHPDVRSPGQ